MRWLRAILLFPLGLLWGLFALLKRKCYVVLGLSQKPTIATWVIGNLHAGGQGKTPTIIALYNWLRIESTMPLEIAILSRGYGRKTKGYRRVTHLESAESVGDEPLEIYHAIKQNTGTIHTENADQILNTEASALSPLSRANDTSQNNQSSVFVCEDRIQGISNIQQTNPIVNMVLLDDGFQHLKLSALGNIVLTKYQEPFSQDMPLPAGNLREFPHASKNADIILVTHSPNNLSLTDANKWKAKFNRQLGFWGVKAGSSKWINDIYFANYFTTAPIEQSSLKLYSTEGKRLGKGKKIILITGIADARGIVNALHEYTIAHHFEYPDHHSFSINDFNTWSKKFNQTIKTNGVHSTSENEKVSEHVFVCSRKDYMRIMSLCKEMDLKHKSEKKSNVSDIVDPENQNDHTNSIPTNISDLPFYVCHSEIEILFNEKHQLLNKILTRKLND